MEQLTFDDLETWKPVPEWEDLYAVSSHGQVESYHRKTPHILRPGYKPKGGYPMVVLCRDGETVNRTVHSLVAEAFIGPRPDGQEVRHLDGNPLNNRWAPGDTEEEIRAAGGNLMYGTGRENTLDQVRHGTHNHSSVEECPQGHEYTPENTLTEHHPDGSAKLRRCRTCRNDFIRDLESRAPESDDDRCQDEEGCDRRIVAKGLCRKHYTRKWQRGRAAAKAA